MVCFIENQGYKSDFYSDAMWRRCFPFNKDMQIDASPGTNFKDTPTVLMVALIFLAP
jgi:hypothetical protein